MVKVSPIQTAFNGGEFSPLLNGQVRLEKRAEALELCQNMIAMKQGPVIRRGGTYFVKEVKDSDKRTEMIDFQFSSSQIYQIEVGDQYFRFYKNNSIITQTAQDITGVTKANPAVVTYSGADNFTNGKEVYISGIVGMEELNGKFFLVANVNAGANTFELQTVDATNVNSTSYDTYVSGGTAAQVYEIASPYTQANLFDSNNIFRIQYFQSGDVLYLLHGSYKMRTLTRTGDASWTLATLTNEDGPYLDVNTTATTMTLSGTSGSVTVTASATTGINDNAGFASTDVGRIIRWKDPANNWTWLTITAYTSTTVVTATISGPNASAGTATANWRMGLWSDTTGWPIAGTFFQDRIVLGGGSSYPDWLALGKTGGYSDTFALFAPSNAAGTVADDNGIVKPLPSRQVNAIQWMAADTTGLVIGTTGQEWTLKASASNEAITPTNAKPDPISSTRSAYIQPILASSGIIFVQSARRKIFDMIYSFDIDRLKPRDISIASEHITRNQILSMAYQQEPLNVIWMVRGDGTLLGLTYYPDEKVFGWHRHIIGGVSDADGTQAQVEAISVIPSSDGSRDELWMIVKRRINGATRRYVEYMTRYYEDDIDLEDAIVMDSALTYDGAATATITGLDHLEGQTVKILKDGREQPDVVVSSGSITLANSRTGSKIQIGLGNRWAIKTLEPEAGAKDGTAQGKTKRVHNVTLKLINTLGLHYGPDEDTTDEYDFDQGNTYDTAPTLFTGNTPPLLFPDGYNQNGQIYLTDNGVFPACIAAIMPQLVTQDR